MSVATIAAGQVNETGLGVDTFEAKLAVEVALLAYEDARREADLLEGTLHAAAAVAERDQAAACLRQARDRYHEELLHDVDRLRAARRARKRSAPLIAGGTGVVS